MQGVSVQGWVSGQDRKFIHSFRLSYGTTGSDLKYYEDSPGIVKVGDCHVHVHVLQLLFLLLVANMYQEQIFNVRKVGN